MTTNTEETKKINVVSTSFVALLKPILSDLCVSEETEDGERIPVCVKREKVIKELKKRHKKALPVTNQMILYHLVGAALESGQLEGYESRRGRNGGVYRSSPAPVKRAKKEAPAAEASAS